MQRSELNGALFGAPMAGGFFAGVFLIETVPHALIVSPKAEGELRGVWLPKYEAVPGATHYSDGLINTDMMAAAGSTLAQQVRALTIGGFADWHVPARDQLELLYRHLKPTTRENAASFRDGDNPSSIPPGYPYTETSPVQTSAAAFQAGGAECFEPAWHWTSTQYSRFNAWCQYFGSGGQDYSVKDTSGCRARAVRRFVLE